MQYKFVCIKQDTNNCYLHISSLGRLFFVVCRMKDLVENITLQTLQKHKNVFKLKRVVSSMISSLFAL